jgi:hypothetical protein
MPIRRDLRKFYGPEWRNLTRPRILERAGNKCEQCGVPNGETVYRVHGMWRGLNGTWWWSGGEPLPADLEKEMRRGGVLSRERRVRIVLTIAHLNHMPGDDRDENLRAWCQWCHLHHDLRVHIEHARETRSTRKDAARPILAALGEVKS